MIEAVVVECDYFYDAEYNGYNARVQEHPEVNASSGGWGGGGAGPRGSKELMLQILTDAWNRTYPDDPKTPADFHLNDVPPWRGAPETVEVFRMPDVQAPPTE